MKHYAVTVVTEVKTSRYKHNCVLHLNDIYEGKFLK